MGFIPPSLVSCSPDGAQRNPGNSLATSTGIVLLRVPDYAALHPGYSPQIVGGFYASFAISRSLNFWILPVDVFGSSVKTT